MYMYTHNFADAERTHILGPLTIVPTCQILKYLDYDFLYGRNGIRELNKSFLNLLNNYGHYINSDGKVILKIDFKKVVQGEVKMPILKHPYYINCHHLNLIVSMTECSTYLFHDLLSSFFPQLQSIKITVVHNYECTEIVFETNPTLEVEFPYTSFFSMLRKNLSKVKIRDNRVNIDWNQFLKIKFDKVPNLQILKLPYHSMFDFKDFGDIDTEIEKLEIEYFEAMSPVKEYNEQLRKRYSHKYERSADVVIRSMLPFVCKNPMGLTLKPYSLNPQKFDDFEDHMEDFKISLLKITQANIDDHDPNFNLRNLKYLKLINLPLSGKNL